MATKGTGGSGGEVEPATSAAGGMCDRFLTFLAKNLSVSRMKSIAADGPTSRNNGSSGDGNCGHPPATEVEEDDDGMDDEDEFAIPIERAEFVDFQSLGGGHGGDVDGRHGGAPTTTILEESAATTTTTTTTGAITDGGAVEAEAAAPVEKETKVRRTVTIKDDRDGGGGSSATATVERKKSSLFGRKRQASSVVGGGAAEERVPRRSGLRPRMPQVPRVPSNINERSSTFIQERRKSFGGGGGGGKSSSAPAEK